MWKGDQPDGSPYSNREFVLFLNGGSVHLSSTPVSRQHRGHIYLDTPRGAVRTGSWHHVAAVLGVMSMVVSCVSTSTASGLPGLLMTAPIHLSDSVICPWAWRPDRSGKE